MGQAADILPDASSNSAPLPATANSADEMLSQLADAEIDRMLVAEGETVGPPAGGAAAVESATSAAVDPASIERPAAQAARGTTAAAALADSVADLNTELDDLLAADLNSNDPLNQAAPAPPTTVSPAEPPAEPDSLVAAATGPAAIAVDPPAAVPEAATPTPVAAWTSAAPPVPGASAKGSAAEAQSAAGAKALPPPPLPADAAAPLETGDLFKVLDPIVARDAELEHAFEEPKDSDGGSSPQEKAALADEAASPARIPLHIRIVDIVMYPLLIVPESWRNAAGAIAIGTLINAGLLLLWVMLFRHRGGH